MPIFGNPWAHGCRIYIRVQWKHPNDKTPLCLQPLYFLNTYRPNSIISYCDNSKFKGDIYELLNFKLVSKGIPSRHWYNDKLKLHVTDNLLRQRGFDQLFKTNYGKTTSNEQLMRDNKFVEIQNSFIKNGKAYGSLRTIESTPEDENYSLGLDAFAMGYLTKASGNYSLAEGL